MKYEFTVKELRNIASKLEIEVPKKITKAELINLIDAYPEVAETQTAEKKTAEAPEKTETQTAEKKTNKRAEAKAKREKERAEKEAAKAAMAAARTAFIEHFMHLGETYNLVIREYAKNCYSIRDNEKGRIITEVLVNTNGYKMNNRAWMCTIANITPAKELYHYYLPFQSHHTFDDTAGLDTLVTYI